MGEAFPRSMTFNRFVTVSSQCYSVCEHNGVTYAGVNGGVDKIAKNSKFSQPFFRLSSGYVEGITVTVYKDNLCLLLLVRSRKPSYTVHVRQLTNGEYITHWPTDIEVSGNNINKLVIIAKQVVIPNPKKKQLNIYTLNGELVNSLYCPELTDTHTAICAAATDSVIITNTQPSNVFWKKITTDQVSREKITTYQVSTCRKDPWQISGYLCPKYVPNSMDPNTYILGAAGVTCYRENYALVAYSNITTSIRVVEVNTGYVLNGSLTETLTDLTETLTDLTEIEATNVFDLDISGNTLIVPCWYGGLVGVKFYQLN